MRSDSRNKRDTGHMDIQNVTGPFLSEAVKWFEDNEIPLYGIQSNPGQEAWTTSPKSYAKLMIDDSALGCPLHYPDDGSRPYVDWVKVESLLVDIGLL
jgi:hypothetical protein